MTTGSSRWAAETVTTADIATYVVNLRRRPDRRERMDRILPSELKATFTSEWEGPFDGAALDRTALEAAGYRFFSWRMVSENSWWSRPLKLGEIGCTLSHLACWRDAEQRPEPYTMILEDDVVLGADFASRLVRALRGLVGCFDLLYLGRFPLERDRLVAPGIVSPGYSHCTFGYLLTRRTVERLVSLRVEHAIAPVDEILPSLYIDHPRADLRARYPRQLTALAFEPPLVQQLPKEVAGSDTEESEFIDE